MKNYFPDHTRRFIFHAVLCVLLMTVFCGCTTVRDGMETGRSTAATTAATGSERLSESTGAETSQIPNSSEIETEPPTEPESTYYGPHNSDQPLLKTKLDYVQDEEIPEQDAAPVLLEEGCLDQDTYSPVFMEGGWILGADDEQKIFCIGSMENELKLVDKAGNETVVYEKLTDKDSSQILDVRWDGGNYVVWTEAPNPPEGPLDITEYHADGWSLWLLDLSDKSKTCIQRDDGIQPPMDSLYQHYAPSIAIADHFIAYLTFAERADGVAVETVMLYDIETGKRRTLSQLHGDYTACGMSRPTIGGGYVAWAEAYLRPSDALYEGYINLYDLTTGETVTLDTEENVINPVLRDDWLIAVNQPNETYYDGEIVAYHMSEQTWRYKISRYYPAYYQSRSYGFGLSDISTWGKYAAWSGQGLENVTLLNLEEGTRIELAKDRREIRTVTLFPGGLLIWVDQFVVDGKIELDRHYCFLAP